MGFFRICCISALLANVPAAFAGEFTIDPAAAARTEVPFPAAPSAVEADFPALKNVSLDEKADLTVGKPDKWVKPQGECGISFLKGDCSAENFRKWNDLAKNALEAKGQELWDDNSVKMLRRLLGYFEANRESIKNTRYLSMADFRIFTDKARMFVFSMNENKVEVYHVAQGVASQDDNRYFTQFGNSTASDRTPRGFHWVGPREHTTEVGYSPRMNGLQPGLNDQSFDRGIFLHPAVYNGQQYVFEDGEAGYPHGYAGHSQGCYALSTKVSETIIERLKEGGIIYGDTSDELFAE